MSETFAPEHNGAAPRSRPFDPGEAWPVPDDRLTNGGARPAPVFPIETLGALGPWVADLAASKGAPVDYAAGAVLALAAGMVGGARSVRIRGGWVEPCVLWCALIGAPSSGKSPPLLALKRAAGAVEREAAGDMSARRREHEARKVEAAAIREKWEHSAKEAAKQSRAAAPMPEEAEEPDEPRAPRLMVADVTTEKLARIIAENPRGVVSVRDELAGLIGNFGKYGGEDAPFYLSAYSGDFSPVDRMKGGTITAERAALSMVGGIQPDKMEALLSGRANDGLVARFLPVWPDPVRRVWDVPEVDEGRAVAIFNRLHGLAMDTGGDGQLVPRVLPFTAAASRAFAAWWRSQGEKTADASGFMAEFLGKADGTCARVALVLELLDWAARADGEPEGPANVSAASVERACCLFADYFELMAARVYADASLPMDERKAVTLLKAIRRQKARRFNAREVYRGENNWRVPGFSNAQDVDAACSVLIEGDCLREVEREPGARGRRAKDYLVNPRLLGARA